VGMSRSLPVATAFGGMVAVWLGMRVFDASGGVGMALLVGGLIGLTATAVWQVLRAARPEGDTRPVETIFALCFVALAVGTGGMVAGSQAGIEWL